MDRRGAVHESRQSGSGQYIHIMGRGTFLCLKCLDTLLILCQLSNITVQLPNLTNLSLGGNGYESITITLSLPQLKQLNLEDNCFKSLGELKPLQTCSNLHSIVLKHNSIRSIYDDGKSPGEASTPIFSNSLEFLDLSDNAINTWTFIDQLPMVAPSLNNLRVSRNPLYETGAGNGNVSQHADDSYMLTLARVKNLSTLNYSQVCCSQSLWEKAV